MNTVTEIILDFSEVYMWSEFLLLKGGNHGQYI